MSFNEIFKRSSNSDGITVLLIRFLYVHYINITCKHINFCRIIEF